MKRLLALLVAVVVIMTGAVNAAAASDVKVFIDDKEVQSQVSAYTEGGRTLVPVRALAESLGFTVAWDPAERRITLSKEGSEIVLWVDSNRVLVNGKEDTIDVPAKITNGSTFVPVRFVAEKLGSVVYWDSKANGAKVFSPKGLFASLEQAGTTPADMKGTFDIEGTTEMAGEGLPGGKATVPVSMHMEMQQYQGDALMSMTTKVPGVPNADQTVQMFTRGGKVFMQNPATGAWTAVSTLDPSQGFDPSSVVKGLPDITKLDQSAMNQVQVTLGGTEEIDGVKVVRLDVDMSKVDMQAIIDAVMKSMGLAEQGAQMTMQVDHMRASYWIQPENRFPRKSVVDMAYTMTVTAQGTTMNIGLTMKMTMQAQPLSEPIKFPI